MSPTPKVGIASPRGDRRKAVPTQPSALLVRFSDFLPRNGLALDLACGDGRNSMYLARQGFSTIGIDRSRTALEAGRQTAALQNLKISFVQADLTRIALKGNSFSAVICFKYRNRDLYPSIRTALRPGGLFVCETYTYEHARCGRKPRDPSHLLERHELLQAFGDWEIIFYREVWIGRGTASLVVRKPLSAIKG